MISYKAEKETAMFGIEISILVGFVSEIFADPYVVFVSFFLSFVMITVWHLGKVIQKPANPHDYL